MLTNLVGHFENHICTGDPDTRGGATTQLSGKREEKRDERKGGMRGTPPPPPTKHTHAYLVECFHKPINIHGDLSFLEVIPPHSLLTTSPMQLGTGRVWHKPMATRTKGECCSLQGDGVQTVTL